MKEALKSIARLFLPPYERKNPPSKPVAIVIPMSARAELTDDERISLRHLHHYLGSFDKFLIAPPGIEFDIDDCTTLHFPGKYFGSAAAHGRLLYAPRFFRTFEDYEYIFFYHLDALVFSDGLIEWCEKGIDYIGPPFMKCDESPWVDRERVGNGGFTLLKVESILKVLRNRHREKPSSCWLDMIARNGRRLLPVLRMLDGTGRVIPGLGALRAPLAEWEAMENPEQNDRQVDLFWSDKAIDFLPDFKVATLEEGLEFAFEVVPRRCFERNGNRMPFGCHAFGRYDRAFWEPHMLPAAEGETGPRETSAAGTA